MQYLFKPEVSSLQFLKRPKAKLQIIVKHVILRQVKLTISAHRRFRLERDSAPWEKGWDRSDGRRDRLKVKSRLSANLADLWYRDCSRK